MLYNGDFELEFDKIEGKPRVLFGLNLVGKRVTFSKTYILSSTSKRKISRNYSLVICFRLFKFSANLNFSANKKQALWLLIQRHKAVISSF